MMKSVSKDEVKDISYGLFNHITSSIKPCVIPNVKVYTGTMVTLSKITSSGLEVIESRIGEVISADNNSVKIRFNDTFGFNDKLYAVMTTTNLRVPMVLVVAYTEKENKIMT